MFSGAFAPPLPPGPGGGGTQETLSVSENGVHNGPDTSEKISETVVVDGLLCSVIKALSTTTDDELVTYLVRDIPEIEIKESWWKLFEMHTQLIINIFFMVLTNYRS